MTDHRFLELPDLLEVGDVLVVNETRVRPARLVGKRPGTGGRVELLVLERRDDGTWETIARPSRRLRPGLTLDFDGLGVTIVSKTDAGKVIVEFDAEDDEAAIARAGSMPLPPYFHGDLPDPERYQTLFASIPGSAAAPTAGLHFTPEVVKRLGERGIPITAVDLHVSLDTFRPMTTDNIEDHAMHSEWCSIPQATVEQIAKARSAGGRVIAVGTTVVRTLETMADGSGGVLPGSARTDLFLRPGSDFQVVDVLITNFHLPGSTLLVLLAAFMGTDWRAAYETALRRGYRFLSFGDAMLAVRSGS